MASPPSFEPRSFLVEPKTWKRHNPEWKTPGSLDERRMIAAAQAQHRLAVEVRKRLFARSEPLSDLADRLYVSYDQLWRKMAGKAPLALPDVALWALITENAELLTTLGIPPAAEDEIADVWPSRQSTASRTPQG